jgi:hypothetical protein
MFSEAALETVAGLVNFDDTKLLDGTWLNLAEDKIRI